MLLSAQQVMKVNGDNVFESALRSKFTFFNVLMTTLKISSLFPKDMIQDIHSLHRNAIRKSIGVARNVGPY